MLLELLTAHATDVGNSNMKAILLHDERQQAGDKAFAELRLWRLSKPVPGSQHDLKYAGGSDLWQLPKALLVVPSAEFSCPNPDHS